MKNFVKESILKFQINAGIVRNMNMKESSIWFHKRLSF